MSILKSKTVHVGSRTLEYSILYSSGQYGIEIKVQNDSKRYFSACDVARDSETAEYLLELFSDNLVFPENAPEIFDDILAGGLL